MTNNTTHPELSLATPLAAYIRVPLTWYHSTTHAFFPDETHNAIRRAYSHPSHQAEKRQFCGYCGTPLSYWSEDPAPEADFIHLTLGSLLREDLQDLEEMGLIPEESDEEEDANKEPESEKKQQQQQITTAPNKSDVLRQSYGVPWFDGLVEGTRLGNMRRKHGIRHSGDGNVRVEWEIIEYSDGSGNSQDDEDVNVDMPTPGSNSKRKRDGEEEEEVEAT
jgi:hypothetical protein